MTEQEKHQQRQEAIDAERKEFWSNAYVPTDPNWQENGTDFINPVDVADQFASATGTSSYLGQQAEIIAEQLAKLDNERSKAQRDLGKIRRVIFADNYSKITKSAGSEIQDAFVLSMATEDQRMAITTLEDVIEGLTQKIERLTPKMEKIRFRMRTLEKNLDWAKQYLDFDKLMQRITAGGRN